MTDAQYEAAIKTIMHHAVVGPGRAQRTLDALTDAGFTVVPPSEAPKATDDDLARFADWVERDRREPDKLLCHAASMRRRAFDLREPPTEPPKACPTCDEAERRIASLRGEIKATVEEVREMQAAIDTAYSAWDSTQYVGGLTEREAYRQAMDALGPLATQHTTGGSGIDGGTA